MANEKHEICLCLWWWNRIEQYRHIYKSNATLDKKNKKRNQQEQKNNGYSDVYLHICVVGYHAKFICNIQVVRSAIAYIYIYISSAWRFRVVNCEKGDR